MYIIQGENLESASEESIAPVGSTLSYSTSGKILMMVIIPKGIDPYVQFTFSNNMAYSKVSLTLVIVGAFSIYGCLVGCLLCWCIHKLVVR